MFLMAKHLVNCYTCINLAMSIFGYLVVPVFVLLLLDWQNVHSLDLVKNIEDIVVMNLPQESFTNLDMLPLEGIPCYSEPCKNVFEFLVFPVP